MATPSTPHPALSLLQLAHPPPTASQIFTDQIRHRPLLLRPSSLDSSSAVSARAARRVARQKKSLAAARAHKAAHKAGRATLTPRSRPLSAKSKRALGVHDIGPEARKWELYTALHALWCDYIRNVLGISPPPTTPAVNGQDQGQAQEQRKSKARQIGPDLAGPMLSSADFHGAILRVTRCRCVSRVGTRGIVVKDTKHTFEVITRDNRFVVLPKEGTVFGIEIPMEGDAINEAENAGDGERYVFELYGGQFMTSAPDRANKKFKMHIDPGL